MQSVCAQCTTRRAVTVSMCIFIRHMNPRHAVKGSINSRVQFIWHAMHYLVTFPSWGLIRSHPSLENSNGTALLWYNAHISPPSATETLLPICSLFYHTNEPRTYHYAGLTHTDLSITPSLSWPVSLDSSICITDMWMVQSHTSCVWAKPFQGNCCLIRPGLNFHVTWDMQPFVRMK